MPPRRRDYDDDYKYMQVIDASSSINQRVNLIGIVIETTLPKRTKGTGKLKFSMFPPFSMVNMATRWKICLKILSVFVLVGVLKIYVAQ